MKKFYEHKLKSLIESNRKSIGYYEQNLLSSIDSEIYYENKQILFDPKSLLNLITSNFINSNILTQCNIIAKNLSTINYIHKYFGPNINNDIVVTVTVSEELIEEISVKYLSTENIHNKNNNKGFNYLLIEKDFNLLAKSDLNDVNYIEELQKTLENYKLKINPKVSLENIIDYCFALNRASSYLNKFELILENNNLELLQKMSPFRRKIDYDLLQYRFIFEEMNSPILDIKVDRYKLLIDSNDLKSIFLEKGETKKFIERIEESLQRKASNLQKNSFEFLNFKEIKEIASSIDISSFDTVIDNLEVKKDELNEKKNQKKNEIYFLFFKFGYKIVNDFSLNMGGIKIENEKNGKKFDLNISAIEKFLIGEKELNKKEKEITNDENENEENENEEKNEENDENKNDENEKTENKNEIETNKENKNETNNEKEKLNKKKKKTNKKNEINNKRKMNSKILGLENENITNENLDEISKGLENYLEIQKINKRIESIENQTKKLKTRKDYNNNFINLLKLYNRLMIKNYYIRDDFFGVIIEDKKVIDNLKKNNEIISEEQEDLREFIIYEINKEKD